jgi:hypothetical protein
MRYPEWDCHPERSEGSLCPRRETLSEAKGDTRRNYKVIGQASQTVGAIVFSRVGFGVEGPEKGDEGGREGE